MACRHWSIRSQNHAERDGNVVRYERWIGQRRQIAPDDAVGERFGHVGRDLDRQAGLAYSAGTGQRQDGDGLIEEPGAGRVPFRRAADQPRPREGC